MSIEKKKTYLKSKILKDFNGDQRRVARIFNLMDRMEESNIPIGYWFLKMKEFKGSPMLKQLAEEYIENIDKNYMEGNSVCFAGNQGTGKTMSSICIAKEALKRNYSAYYTSAYDIVADMTNNETRYRTQQRLKTVDFLIIDEVDSRFFPSDAQKELFSSIYENIFRSRAHNTFPTILCSNETESILNVFYGAGTQSIRSLNDQYLTVYPVVGKDFRKKIGGEE